MLGMCLGGPLSGTWQTEPGRTFRVSQETPIPDPDPKQNRVVLVLPVLGTYHWDTKKRAWQWQGWE